MFGLNSKGSNDPQNKNQTNDEKINFSEDNFKLEDFPIHTMKEDLKELQNPSLKKEIKIETIEPKKTFSFDAKPQNVSPEKNGPFFRPEPQKTQEKPATYAPKVAEIKNEPLYFDESIELPKKIAPNNQKEIPVPTPIAKPTPTTKINEKINLNSQVIPKENTNQPHHGIGKAIFIAVIIFIILIAGAGGYYFWMTRLSTPLEKNIISTEPTVILPENEIPPETTTPIPILSSQNSNYLQINLTQATAENLKQTLSEYAVRVSETNEVGTFEFLITDETNTPVTFQDFSATLGLSLPVNITTQIGQDFSLCIYNYGDKTRFGLILASLNDTLLKNALLKEENNLLASLSPLYPTLNSPITSTFSPTTYKNYTVRYFNITSQDDYAIDYTVVKNKLVIGTTKTTLFSALDRLSE